MTLTRNHNLSVRIYFEFLLVFYRINRSYTACLFRLSNCSIFTSEHLWDMIPTVITFSVYQYNTRSKFCTISILRYAYLALYFLNSDIKKNHFSFDVFKTAICLIRLQHPSPVCFGSCIKYSSRVFPICCVSVVVVEDIGLLLFSLVSCWR